MSRRNDLKFGRGKSVTLLTIVGFIFLYTPIIVLIIYSFNYSRFSSTWGGWSLQWYYKLFDDSSMWLAIKNSLLIGFVSTFFATILGTISALVIKRFTFKTKALFTNLLFVPVVIPEIVLGILLLLLYNLIKLELGLTSIILAHITFSIPFVTLVVLNNLKNFDSTIEEVGMDLGATPWQIFWKITFPNISTGILAGALLAFTLSIEDFTITFFTSGPGATTLPLKIYSMIKFGITPEINAISTLLVLFTTIILGAMYYILNKQEKKLVT